MLKHCRPDILARGHLSLLHRTVNDQTKNRTLSRTNRVVGEGGMIAKINSPFNSPFSRAPRQEPTAQLAEGQDVVANVVAGSSPGMCFSHTPHPLTLTVPDLLTDLTPLNTKMVHVEIRRLALEPLQAPHQIGGRLTWFLRNWQK